MMLESLIATAKANGASDLHLEPGLPPMLRIDGTLRPAGEPIDGKAMLEAAREVLGEEAWLGFEARRSADLSVAISGVRCRLNVLHTARGVGMAIRLLASFAATIERLNLHPDLRRLARLPYGLVLTSGPTGCGKSTTLAAFIQEINLAEARHVVTVEAPIEYTFKPKKAFIRQREVGRDTPSFEQALLDALREDPDVLMVGEMRDPATMRLTLQASETGHLVFATVHSASTVEALQRVVSAFAPEIQSSVRAALADCLQAVVCQRLRYRPDLRLRVPECEILTVTHAVKNFIRTGEFFKIQTLLETGAEHGMWTFARYQRWLDQRREWAQPSQSEPEERDTEPPTVMVSRPPNVAQVSAIAVPPAAAGGANPSRRGPGGRTIEIEPVEGGLAEVVKKLSK